jgi:hypothetical protein
VAQVLILSFYVAIILASGFCYYRISERLGYDGLQGIILLIPVVGVIIMFRWALNDSPRELKIKDLERRLAALRQQTEDKQVDALNKLSS